MSFQHLLKSPGIAFGNDKCWKVLRKFTLANMKDFRIGMQSLEERIQEEAQYLVEELQNTKGEHQSWVKREKEDRKEDTEWKKTERNREESVAIKIGFHIAIEWLVKR